MIIGFVETEIIDANNRMQNYRKTRKRGGHIVYRCPIKSKPKDCIERYLHEANIELIHIKPDGNCFFNSLSTYFKLNGITISPMELRQRVVSYMEEHREEYEPFFIVESEKPAVKRATMTRQFTQLKKSGSWNSQLADFIPQEAPKALDINILLYEVSESGETISTNLLRDDTKPMRITERYPTIHVLRINRNHYELLRPIKRENNLLNESESKTKTKTATQKNRKLSLTENEIKTFEKQFQNIQVRENEEVAKKLVKELENEQKRIQNNQEYARKLAKEEREEKIRKHYLKKKKERNAQTKKNINEQRLLNEYQRLSNLGAFN